MTVVKMPQLGETVIEGTILKWLKQEGDQVALDEPLFEISTDKVDTEVPSSAAGVLSKIMVPEGETVAVGTELAEIAGGWGGWRRSSGGCGAARFGSVLGRRDLVTTRTWRRCPLRPGTNRHYAGSPAGSRFGAGGRAAAGGSGAAVADLVAARSEAGGRERGGSRAGLGDGDRGADHEERRAGVRRRAGCGSANGRRDRSRSPPSSPLLRPRHHRRPPRQSRRSRRSRWGAARRSCRSRTSASRSPST